MDNEKLESLMIDYIDGKLSGELSQIVESHIQKSEAHMQKYLSLKKVMGLMDESEALTPSNSLRQGFEAMLSDAQDALPEKGRRRWLWDQWPIPVRAAAAVALLALGAGFGMYWGMQRTADQVAANKAAILELLQNSQSAGQRIKAANTSMMVEGIDLDIINAMFKTLQNDPNTNVRLAALDALERFVNEPLVRKGLISCLEMQDDPVVQIALINRLAKLREDGAKAAIQKLTEDPKVDTTVKSEAHYGLFKLM